MADKFQIKIHRVISEIEEELGNIEILLSELKEHQQEELRNSFYFRAVGSILHDFYYGVERIFERCCNKESYLTYKGHPSDKEKGIEELPLRGHLTNCKLF